ncbi:50S ribosomal protein L31 [Mycoplasma bradburyae]|uniref:50S ribosomal protein L31 n=1 Tax=Mycoplasma bradburyae TaxID=2963128 RepID=A0AAW6HS79_9MOLU|nr:50S ribosomal protein L31 [Mycoplasma bradburyae]MDC4163098.1 50S ribosomal protein L31 [Mycoplasma bradburyae]MDC4181707.1 50S ribosomal protein L31 [Mycoplasma bradburyae]MDC4182415.1 50S ribosomal protein L31 [Mycoplasma bradburyae]MDC4183633.1 50S ribosomal protein L31 [Mycoplasma bradburyae]MDC4183881.1 50S ribosomal protein L31 [Mycoplasma bradburyae]
MKKDIHPTLNKVAFICSSCNNKYELLSVIKAKEVPMDVCSGCHSFYIGETTQQAVKGRAEKLSSKFSQGKANINKKSEAKTKESKASKKSNDKSKSLKDL